MRRRALIAMAATGALVASGPAFAEPKPDAVLGPVAVSGTTPFPGCTAGSTPTSTNYTGSEVEPWVSVNPRDPRNIVTEWQQDRWSDGGSHGLVAGVTHDGGRHWKKVVVPGTTQCAGGTYERASDPGVSFAPNGDLYAISLSFNANDFGNALLVSKSTDGGDHWGAPVTLKSDTEEAFFNDKELITADPTSSQRAYAVWDRSNEQGGQPVWFARTVDGGKSWEPAKILYDPTPGFTIANQIVVQPDGTLVDMFFEGPAGGGEEPDRPQNQGDVKLAPRPKAQPDQSMRIRVIRSRDHGATWSAPDTVAVINPAEPVDPDTHAALRTGDIVPDIAVDQHTGRLYVVWQDAGASRSQSAILLSSSGDAGRTWTKPVKVSKTPDSDPQGNGQAFTATVDVAAGGTVGVTYYDFRRNTPAAGALTDYWAVTCGGGACAKNPDAWREQHVGGSFDTELSPVARGFFLGDYMALDHAGPAFVSVFSMTHDIPGNQQDEFAAGILPSGTR
ncbi:sialidase family protein [Actinomadura rupiterrae]|uniref:sialidase family protein n=1 Tax=Actinomadura rupiterrae TaxID=559627 RepID=UPI0020A3EB31|nr:sialidase family protein [Actinomadura rupiterrae]MCP2343016.1 hypothetical protein [Actinomadura rupiterrae]